MFQRWDLLLVSAQHLFQDVKKLFCSLLLLGLHTLEREAKSIFPLLS